MCVAGVPEIPLGSEAAAGPPARQINGPVALGESYQLARQGICGSKSAAFLQDAGVFFLFNMDLLRIGQEERMWKDGGPWGTSVNEALDYTGGITGDLLSPHAPFGHLRSSLTRSCPFVFQKKGGERTQSWQRLPRCSPLSEGGEGRRRPAPTARPRVLRAALHKLPVGGGKRMQISLMDYDRGPCCVDNRLPRRPNISHSQVAFLLKELLCHFSPS